MKWLKNKTTEMSKFRGKKINEEGGSDLSLLSLAWDLGWMIVIPIVIFATGGALLDKSMDTTPWMLLGGIGLSLITTSIMVYRKTLEAMNMLSGVNDKKIK